MHETRRPSVKHQSHDKKALFLGTALGVGNFLFLPKLFSQYDFRLVLFFHLITLFLLGAPLLVGELIWGRWLRRNPIDAFVFLKKPFKYTPYFSLLALAGLSPLYLLEVKNLLYWCVNVWSESGTLIPSFQTLPISQNLIWSLFGILVIIAALIPVIKMSRERIRIVYLWSLVGVAILLMLSLMLQPISFWTVNKNFLFRASRSLSVNRELLLDVAALSLFTLSVGLGVHYWFTVWLSPLRRSVEEMQQFWKHPGRVHRLVLQVIFFDFALTLIAALFLMPWLSLMPLEGTELTFSRVFLEWWPEYLRAFSGGIYVMRFLSLALLVLGYLSLSSLVLLGVYSTRLMLGMRPRGSAIFFLSYLGIAGLIVSVPVFMAPAEALVQDVLLPVAALLWALSVGMNFPKKDLYLVLGRSQVSDALTVLWYFSLRYLVPVFLVVYLILRISSWAGMLYGTFF